MTKRGLVKEGKRSPILHESALKICVENYERCPFQVNIKRLEILKLEYNNIYESS